jgi:hypothetical protein
MSEVMKLSFTPSPLLASLLLALPLTVACGNSEPGSGAPTGNQGEAGAGSGGEGPSGPLLPWAVGNTWTYQVTQDGVTSLKTTTVGELEPVGGEGPNSELMAYHVVTAKGADQKDKTESWQAPSEDEPERVVRFREQSFDATSGNLELEEYWEPSKLHIDGTTEHTSAGASWLETYTETKLPVGLSPTTHEVHERWSVIEADATLDVPAGTFQHVIHLQKVGGSSTKDYWYLRGVGKLEETGSQTEELTEYQLEDAP